MLTDSLKCWFGQETFRNNVQQLATYAVFEGKWNVCIRMPPMSGQSVCYLLPAILQKGKITIIISPALSYVKDQMKFLDTKGVKTYYYTAKMSKKQEESLIQALLSGVSTGIMLCVTGEVSKRINFKDLMELLKRKKLLSYIVIEEADCISKIGPNFKQYYLGISRYKYVFPGIPVIMMTRVGTMQIMEDVFKRLGVYKPIIFSVPTFCPSVYYDVWFLDTLQQPFHHLKEYIVKSCGYSDTSMPQGTQNKSVIYCKTRDVTETIARTLSLLGIPTLAYHPGFKYKLRADIKKKWLFGEAHVIAITTDIASDVHDVSMRCIVHWMIPESITKYYLRTANSSLYVEKVFSRIYFSNKEYSALTLPHKEESTLNSARMKMKRKELITSISFCLIMECRHVFISKYFGEDLSPCESSCDICYETAQTRRKLHDFKVHTNSYGTSEYKNIYTDVTPQMCNDFERCSVEPMKKQLSPEIECIGHYTGCTDVTPQMCNDFERCSVKPMKKQFSPEIECIGHYKRVSKKSTIRIITGEGEGTYKKVSPVQRHANKFCDTLTTRVMDRRKHDFDRENKLPTKLLSKKNEEHVRLNAASAVDNRVRNSKRKVIELEDKAMGHVNKKHKYNDSGKTIASSDIDQRTGVITTTKTKEDIAKHLMIKHNLNPNEISLLPCQRSK